MTRVKHHVEGNTAASVQEHRMLLGNVWIPNSPNVYFVGCIKSILVRSNACTVKKADAVRQNT